MKSILFVDDEAKVLDGLRRLLRPMRRQWHMAFCLGGEEALRTLEQEAFDVIVSDMRMPGMDGAALLAEVMHRHPNIVRIVLSGQSSKETTLRSIGVAHQFLAKPCDPELLKQTVNHAFALRNVLTSEALKQTVSQLKSVPSLPSLYEQIREELEHPDASAKRVGDIVAQDPGMTAKVLQLVNSAFFGLPRHVSSPSQAASLLGTDTIRLLVLGIDVFSQFEGDMITDLSASRIQEHSLLVAAMSKQIAAMEKAPREIADAALMAGLLHDIGLLILAQNLPEQYARALQRVSHDNIPLPVAEQEEFGASHGQVAAYLLGLWGLPDQITEATAFHHAPSESFGKTFAPLTAVHVADVFAFERTGGTYESALDMDYLERLGLADRVDTWRESCESVSPEGATV